MNIKSIKDLFQETLNSPGNEDLLKELIDRKEEFFENADDFDDIGAPEEANEIAVEWYMRVQGELFQCTLSPEDLAQQEEWKRMREEDNLKLGKGLKALMDSLPEDLRDLEKWFGNFPSVEEEKAQWLFKNFEPGSSEAMPYSKILNKYGLSIESLFRGAHSVAMLLSRLYHHNLFPKDCPATFAKNIFVDLSDGQVVSLFYVAANEIRSTNHYEIDQRVSETILEWLREVAKEKPFIFPGYQAQVAEIFGDTSVLTLWSHKNSKDFSVWGM